jgi:hypothetical protein
MINSSNWNDVKNKHVDENNTIKKKSKESKPEAEITLRITYIPPLRKPVKINLRNILSLKHKQNHEGIF